VRKLSVFKSVAIFIGITLVLNGLNGFCGEIDKSRIPFLKWMGPGQPGTYEEYLAQRPEEPFFIEEIRTPEYSLRAPKKKEKVLVVVASSIYPSLSSQVNQYINSLKSNGYRVQLYKTGGGKAENLKQFIKKRKKRLIGCVFIGNVPTAWYEVANDHEEYGYAEFPCDLFLMDLDGQWKDTDSNGKYDSHTDGNGDREPEIFVARIDASQMSGTEVDTLKQYFTKNNNYWSGKTRFREFGLTYTEDDWKNFNDFSHDISNLYKKYQSIVAPKTERDDYLNKRLKKKKYTFIQIACHSSSSGHKFTRGGWLTSTEVRQAPPQGLAFNLFACSACRWTRTTRRWLANAC